MNTLIHMASAQVVGTVHRIEPGFDATPWRVLVEVRGPAGAPSTKTLVAVVARGTPATDLIAAFSDPRGAIGREIYVSGELRTRGCRMPIEEVQRRRQDAELLTWGSLVQVIANKLRVLPREEEG